MKTLYAYKKIKKGNIAKLVKSKKMRDDIPCGASQCISCDKNIYTGLSLNEDIIVLDADLIMEQIDSLENFEVIRNCIVPQSEYVYLNEVNFTVMQRLNSIMENRNLYIFPNEFHKDIQLLMENSLKKKSRRNQLFINTLSYLGNHFSAISSELRIIILTTQENKILYRSHLHESYFFNYTFNEYAYSEMKEYPDLYNYIANFDEASYNQMEIDEEDDMKSSQMAQLTVSYTKHLSEFEMKANIKSGIMFQGKIMFQPGVYDTAIVKCYLFDKEILLNSPDKINRAIQGDIVCIQILDQSEWISKSNVSLSGVDAVLEAEQDMDERNLIEETDVMSELKQNIKEKIESSPMQPVGIVRGILRRSRDQFCGTIYNPADKDNVKLYEKRLYSIKNYSVFIPVDAKFPNFFIRLHQPELYYSQRILVKIDNWHENNMLPNCHFLKNLGPIGDVKVENEIILYEHNVNINPFSLKIINSMPREDVEFKVDDEELSKRLDLRDTCICSIDPPGCKDIDDALHCKQLPNGNYEVGVHIADVTHYVKPGTEVDKIAARSSNTVYLVHKRTDMLPKVLTENLCSLVGGKERLAFSCLWEFDKDTLEVISHSFAKTVIKSRAALTYEQANTKMNDTKDNSELAQSIRNLNKLARYLKSKRIDAGALILASNEMKFNVNFETNTINDISMYKTFETNSLVEEFMLLANVYVADKIYTAYPSCAVLRRHPQPKEKELKALQNLLIQHGYDINIENSKNLSESLDKIKKLNDPFFNKLIRIMLTRTMNQAKYFGSSEFGYEDFYHYGLAMPIYTHFTSPIRRYADVLVHRLLAAALDADYLPLDIINKVKLMKQCDQMNKQNRVAFFCGRDSNDFSTYLFFSENKARSTMEVVIFAVEISGIKGISVEFGIEGDVVFPNVKSIDTEKKLIYLSDSDQPLRIFDHVLVEIRAGFFNYRREIKYNFIEKI